MKNLRQNTIAIVAFIIRYFVIIENVTYDINFFDLVIIFIITTFIVISA